MSRHTLTVIKRCGNNALPNAMRLLIVTQKVDMNDSMLGFFHSWILELAKHFEYITVICLFRGEYDLPKNVRVFSLGKEEEGSRIRKTLRYVIRFYGYIWGERKNYDAIFVHMNQEYVLLGAPLWKLLGKKVTMWRNHHFGNIFTRLAMIFCDTIFCTSQYSFTATSPKTVLMPVGIDTEHFYRDDRIKRENKSILFLARMSPVKRPHLVIESLRRLNETGTKFAADFYGDSLPKDTPYLESLKEKIKEYALDGHIIFKEGISNSKTPYIYAAHDIFINASPSGMYDKTIFEAMACESLVLVSNLNLKGQIDDLFIFKENDEADLSKKLKPLLKLDANARERYGKVLRTYVVDRQSLTLLARTLFNRLQL